MYHTINQTLETAREVGNDFLRIDRLTALWALSEAALGGVLHALRFPMTGLLINSSAVVFISLIAYYATHKGAILRATLIVLIIKGMVSPHTPVNAFIAVTFQGVLGEILFRTKKYFTLSAILLAIVTLLQSGTQKIVVLTIVFGNNLWESINIFTNFVLQKFHISDAGSGIYDISFWIICGYLVLHGLVGVLVGILASRIPGWIDKELVRYHQSIPVDEFSTPSQIKVFKKKKSWLRRPSGIAIFILAAIIVLLSYIYPEISAKQSTKAVIMILRSITIMAIWYIWIGPKLLTLLNRMLKKKQNQYYIQVHNTLQILPPLRAIIYQTWNSAKKYSTLKRIKTFILLTLVSSLSGKLQYHESD